MISETVPILTGIAIILIWQVIAYFTKPGLGRNILISAFILYISIVISVTIFPLPYQKAFFDCFLCGYEMNLIPFKSIISTIASVPITDIVKQLLGNIVLCIPYGIMLPFLLKKRSPLILILLAPLLSVCIESSQLIIGLCLCPDMLYRVVDIDDVILNTLGTFIGYLIYRYLPQNIKDFFMGRKTATEN